jgi:hypothetical protein
MVELACPPAAKKTGKTKRKRAKEAKAKRAMGLVEYERLRARVRRLTCSEPWTDAVVHRNTEYPPGGATTGMRPCCCDNCREKRWWPANFVGAGGVAYECFLNTLPLWRLNQLPGSTSSMNQARLNRARRAGKDCEGGF